MLRRATWSRRADASERIRKMNRPVDVRLNGTAAQLLARLCVETQTDDPSGLVVRALGLFEVAMRTRRQGGRLVFVNERGEESEVAF